LIASFTVTAGTVPSEAQPMSEERRKFLEAAMAQMTVDPAHRMRVLVGVLRTPDSVDRPLEEQLAAFPAVASDEEKTVRPPESALAPEEIALLDKNEPLWRQQRRLAQWPTLTLEEKLSLSKDIAAKKDMALDEIEDFICQIDFACDFFKAGGLAVLKSVVNVSGHRDVRSKALQVLGTCIQNNPFNQQFALDGDLLPWLLGLLASTNNFVDKAKVVYVLSALLRNFPAAETAFNAPELAGIARLAHALTEETATVATQRKTLLLLRHLWKNKAHIALPDDSPLFKIIVSWIDHEDVDLREGAIGAIKDLVGNRTNLQNLRKPELATKEKLARRLERVRAMTGEEAEQCRDELPVLEVLLRLL